MCPHIVFKFRDYSLQIHDLPCMPANQAELGLLIDRFVIVDSPSVQGLTFCVSCVPLASPHLGPRILAPSNPRAMVVSGPFRGL